MPPRKKGRTQTPEATKKKIFAKLENDGYDMNKAKRLGSGQMGTAYKLKDRVIKITKDKSEAIALSYVRQHPHPNIVKAFRVWRYKAIPERYVIEQELLKRISESMLDRVILFEYKEMDLPEDKFPFFHNFFEEFNGITWGDVFATTSGKSDGTAPVEESKRMSNRIKQNLDLDGKKLGKNSQKVCNDILKAALHLRKIGVVFEDYHSGNIMKSNDGFKLIDLGLSKAPGKVDDIRESEL